jgi:uncharacterized protein (DUF362 family)
MKRRTFLKTGVTATIVASLQPGSLIGKNQAPLPDVVRVNNGQPQQLFYTAISALGGMSTFISRGDMVVVKPNIGWARAPEYAANTNPDLIAAIITSCYSAGAKEVKLFDRTCNDPRRCYRSSKIEEKAAEVGADVSQIRKNKFSQIKLKNGQVLKEWEIYKDYLDADKIINVPIAKQHSLCHVSLGDITSEILPTLTIIDAYRILTANGPTGGNIADVKIQKSLIASSCIVSADTTALDLFSLQLSQVGHINEMVTRGMNKFDITNLNISEINIGS